MSRASQAAALLKGLSVEDLKEAWRDARLREKTGDKDANEARRLVTVELLRRLPRGEVALFERDERRAAA